MHPGWADTPGITDSLPGFSRALGPILRTAEQGADTAVWLLGADVEPGAVLARPPLRARRPTCPWTEPSAEQARRLWDFCEQATATG